MNILLLIRKLQSQVGKKGIHCFVGTIGSAMSSMVAPRSLFGSSNAHDDSFSMFPKHLQRFARVRVHFQILFRTSLRRLPC
jgi:hypothetical protein